MAYENPVTSDLSEYGYRELKMAADLLTAYCANKPDYLGDGVHVAFDKISGLVFLRDKNHNQFHKCPECGCAGSDEDLVENGDGCCREYLSN